MCNVDHSNQFVCAHASTLISKGKSESQPYDHESPPQTSKYLIDNLSIAGTTYTLQIRGNELKAYGTNKGDQSDRNYGHGLEGLRVCQGEFRCAFEGESVFDVDLRPDSLIIDDESSVASILSSSSSTRSVQSSIPPQQSDDTVLGGLLIGGREEES